MGCKSAPTPINTSIKLCKQDGSPLIDSISYRRLIDKLIYLTNTRPDISFTVQQLSQFLDSPT